MAIVCKSILALISLKWVSLYVESKRVLKMLKTDLSNQVIEIIRSAVNLAKVEQIKSLKSLRERLNSAYPNHKNDVDDAINQWITYEKDKP